MQSLIAWLNECNGHLLSTIAQPWTAPDSLLGHSWPTFSLLYQFSLPSLFFYEQNFLVRLVSKTPSEVSIISEWPSYVSLRTTVNRINSKGKKDKTKYRFMVFFLVKVLPLYFINNIYWKNSYWMLSIYTIYSLYIQYTLSLFIYNMYLHALACRFDWILELFVTTLRYKIRN